MKTVRDACLLQENALSIKLSDQIEQLDELIYAEGDGSSFFEKTHITQGMQDLISEGVARLAGVSTQAIFHLKQAMGGGKTHLLVGFGLLARHPELRKNFLRWNAPRYDVQGGQDCRVQRSKQSAPFLLGRDREPTREAGTFSRVLGVRS